MSDDPFDRHSLPVCTYLHPEEEADIADGPDPPGWLVIAALLAAASLGLWIVRLL